VLINRPHDQYLFAEPWTTPLQMFSNVCSCFVTHRKISHQVPQKQQSNCLMKFAQEKFSCSVENTISIASAPTAIQRKLITAAPTVTKQGQLRS
jgi:hypothetical protein